MFDLSFGEIIMVVVVAVVFIGPKELPTVIRALSKGLKAVRALTAEVRGMFDDLAKESGVDELKSEVKMIQGDDGKWYESYPHVVPPLPQDTPKETL